MVRVNTVYEIRLYRSVPLFLPGFACNVYNAFSGLEMVAGYLLSTQLNVSSCSLMASRVTKVELGEGYKEEGERRGEAAEKRRNQMGIL